MELRGKERNGFKRNRRDGIERNGMEWNGTRCLDSWRRSNDTKLKESYITNADYPKLPVATLAMR